MRLIIPGFSYLSPGYILVQFFQTIIDKLTIVLKCKNTSLIEEADLIKYGAEEIQKAETLVGLKIPITALLEIASVPGIDSISLPIYAYPPNDPTIEDLEQHGLIPKVQ